MESNKDPLNPILRQLEFNPQTGYYEASEDNITYHLTFQQVPELVKFCMDNAADPSTLKHWYESMDPKKQKEFVRTTNMNERSQLPRDEQAGRLELFPGASVIHPDGHDK